jgi:hypothetical protein
MIALVGAYLKIYAHWPAQQECSLLFEEFFRLRDQLQALSKDPI